MVHVPVTQSVPAEGPRVLNDEFKDFVRRSLKGLFGRAYWRCNDVHLAEDFVQDTYLRLWVAWRDRPGSITDPRAYANKILDNVCADYYRKLRPEVNGEIPETSSDSGEEQAARLDDLRLAIAGLPPQQRELIYLHYYEGLSLAEAADAMGIAAKTAHNYHTLAKNRLRKQCGRNSVTAIAHGDPGAAKEGL